jgi:hypothetical protein
VSVRILGALLLIGLTFGDLTGVRAAGVAPEYSASALYNQGNANARAGKRGLAVLNYERARLLAPDDPDIVANLRSVREAARLPVVVPTWFERRGLMLNPTAMAWTGVLGVLLVGGGWVWAAYRPGYRWTRYLSLPGLALLGLATGNAIVLWPVIHEAVVLTASAPVRVTPVPMGDPAFVLPEAETVRVSAEHDDFFLIRTRTGRTGWVARANLAPVVPR